MLIYRMIIKCYENYLSITFYIHEMYNVLNNNLFCKFDTEALVKLIMYLIIDT